MAYHTYADGIVLDRVTMRGRPAISATITDAATGDTVQAYSMGEDPAAFTLSTNAWGYFPQFQTLDTHVNIRLTFGKLTLSRVAFETITDALAAALGAEQSALQAAADAAAAASLVGAPADTAIKTILDSGTSLTRIKLDGLYASKAVATTAVAGLMSAADKTKLDGAPTSALATSVANGLMPAADKAKLDLATSGATASRLMIRDGSGRVGVATPAAAGDAATKGYVDGRTPAASTTVAGLMSAADKKKLDGIRVNVSDYGAVGDGVTDDFVAIKAALAATPVGGTLYFPSTRYFTTYKDHTVEANYLVIDKNGIKFEGDATLENFLIYIKGTYGAPVSIAATIPEGASTFSTATAHGLVAGDYMQMLSCVNAYTPDGGAWQLGSKSPTDGQQPIARYAEIHQVAQAPSTTALTIIDEVVYPTHQATSAGLTVPIAGVANSQVRKLSMVKDIQFVGLTFKNVTATSFRGIMARAAAGLRFVKCRFETGSEPGALVKMTDSHNVRFLNCTSSRRLDTFSGSSWNTFFVGGGCHGVYFEGGDFAGEAQAIDFTPNTFTSDIGGAPDSALSMSTLQFFGVFQASFRACSDAMTSHPGTYMFEASGNVIDGGSVGIRARSRASIIRGNTIHTGRGGVALSSFQTDSLVSGNTIVQKVSAKYSGFYTGIAYNATSSEIESDNAVKNLVISGNGIKVTTTNAVNAAIQLMHYDPPSFPLTNATKVRASEILVEGNNIRKGSIVVSKWINSALIQDNQFSGGSDRAYYIITEAESAANSIIGNTFADTSALPVQTGAVTLTGHGYSTLHRVAQQRGAVGLGVSSLANVGSVFGQSGTIWDALELGNAGKLSAVRAAGAATLNLDAIASDGTSAVTIKAFGGNTTTGTKLFDVDGRMMADDFQVGFGSRIHGGAGTPEGVVSAPVGSLYLRTDGGAGTSLYVKQTGTGNTGWVGK